MIISRFPMGGSAELKKANGSKSVTATYVGLRNYYFDFTLTGLEFRPVVVYFYFASQAYSSNKFLLSDVSGSTVLGENGYTAATPSTFSITDDGFKFYTYNGDEATTTTVYWWAAGI